MTMEINLINNYVSQFLSSKTVSNENTDIF